MTDILKMQIIMTQWCKRRDNSGKPYNADDIWARIKFNWPSLSDEDAELVFQGCIPSTVENMKSMRSLK